MKSARLVPLLIGVLGLAASGAAMAGGLSVGVNIGIPASKVAITKIKIDKDRKAALERKGKKDSGKKVAESVVAADQ